MRIGGAAIAMLVFIAALQPATSLAQRVFPSGTDSRGAAGVGLQPQDTVLGVCRGNACRAYPLSILTAHGVVNDVLDASPLLVLYDATTIMAHAYDTEVGGRILHFEWIGMREGVPILRDQESGTHWSQNTGRALEGALAGRSLVRIPVYAITWARWRELHPGTTVLAGTAQTTAGPEASHLPPPPSNTAGSRRADRRLSPDTLVLGVAGVNEAFAVPLDSLAGSPGAINDHLDRRMTVVFFDAAGRAAAAYRPAARGKALVFRSDDRRDGRVFIDNQTGSTWTLEGTAVAGPMKGAELPPESFTISRWRAWSSLHPRTRVFDPHRWR